MSLSKLKKVFDGVAKKQQSPWKYFDAQGKISAQMLNKALNNPE